MSYFLHCLESLASNLRNRETVARDLNFYVTRTVHRQDFGAKTLHYHNGAPVADILKYLILNHHLDYHFALRNFLQA